MEINYLKEVKEILEKALKDNNYVQDFDFIQQLLDLLNETTYDNINTLDIEKLENDLNYLVTKYFNMYELPYYASPLIVSIKDIDHQNKVKKIREDFSKKKEGK